MGTISKKLIESFNYQVNEADDDETTIFQYIRQLERSSNPEDKELARQAKAKLLGGTPSAAPSTAGAVSKPGGNPEVAKLQTELNRAGANLQVDGLMGPLTSAAMRQFPAVAAKFPNIKPSASAGGAANTAQVGKILDRIDAIYKKAGVGAA